MATQKGTKAVVFSIPGTSATITVKSVKGVTVSSNNTFTVIRETRWSGECDKKEVRSGGDVVNVTHYNRWETLSVTVVPTDTSLANALAAYNNCPHKGDLVEYSATSGDTQAVGAETTTNNDYIVERAEKSATDDGEAVITMDLMRYAADLDVLS